MIPRKECPEASPFHSRPPITSDSFLYLKSKSLNNEIQREAFPLCYFSLWVERMKKKGKKKKKNCKKKKPISLQARKAFAGGNRWSGQKRERMKTIAKNKEERKKIAFWGAHCTASRERERAVWSNSHVYPPISIRRSTSNDFIGHDRSYRRFRTCSSTTHPKIKSTKPRPLSLTLFSSSLSASTNRWCSYCTF